MTGLTHINMALSTLLIAFLLNSATLPPSVFAETPTARQTATVTNIISDVPTSDPHYNDIHNLITRWHIPLLNAKREFQPQAPVTHSEFATTLNAALDQLLHINHEQDPNSPEIPPVDPSATLPLTDVTAKDPVYSSLLSLQYRYGIGMSNSKNEFEPNATITMSHLQQMLQQVFLYNEVPASNDIVTHDVFATYLNKALETAAKPLYEKPATLPQKPQIAPKPATPKP